ncbi:guanylate-binding protein 1-like [Montipora capricornis]|uniref:guanylate-binding protein 1-like n=1 Tax=Montipora capricornis TaxID=246305 RepID=UPI0035F1EBCF
MNHLVLVAGAILFATSGFKYSVAKDHRAQVLLEVDNNKTFYKLNPNALKEIAELKSPIQVISAVGNARVGKSTMLNLMSHILDERNADSDSVQEIFETGDLVKAVTRNVWSHIIPKPEGGSILLVDVEGTNLGDDKVTAHLSMFTAMISARLILFTRDYVGNTDIDFLYHISRLSYLVFPKKEDLQNFRPELHIVVRTNLQPLDEDGNYIREELLKSQSDKVKIIRKCFPPHKITVSHIKSVLDPTVLTDVGALHNTTNWIAFEKISAIFKDSPEKRSLQGNLVDGETLKDLAEILLKQMNRNEWGSFGDAYSAWERDICRTSYEKHVKPMLILSSDEIVKFMMKTMEEFKEKCILDSEIRDAEENLMKALKDAKRREEEEEEKKRKEQEERRKQEESDSYFNYNNLKMVCLVAGSHILRYLLSDEQLKTKFTTIPYSPYNAIGLSGVCWEWNKQAGKKFGLTGKRCGVIAQDVQRLYPWAVVKSKDGYLQVGYHILDRMINDALNGHDLAEPVETKKSRLQLKND